MRHRRVHATSRGIPDRAVDTNHGGSTIALLTLVLNSLTVAVEATQTTSSQENNVNALAEVSISVN